MNNARDFDPSYDVSHSSEGCEIAAGGRRPPERVQMMVGTLKGVRDLMDSIRAGAGTPSGCESLTSLTGGLRFAPTSGYSLTTLRVANT